MVDYLTKRIQEKLLARGRAEQARADEWRRSLKPTVYRGNNLFQEMGGEPLEGRYLGQQGLIPGQSVPNIGRNPNKPVIPGLPVDPVPAPEEEVFIPKAAANGMFFLYDINCWYSSSANNTVIAEGMFISKTSTVDYLTTSDPRFYSLEYSVAVPEKLSRINNALSILNQSWRSLPSIPEAVQGQTFYLPLFDFNTYTLTAEEISRLKKQAKIGRVIIQCERSPWAAMNNYYLQAFGLSSFVTNGGEPSYVNLGVSSKTSNYFKGILPKWEKSGEPSLTTNAAYSYVVSSPVVGILRTNSDAQIRHILFFVPSTYF